MSLAETVQTIYQKVPYQVDVGIVCGSGLSNIASQMQNAIIIPYSDIPNFPHSAVVGHKNEMVIGDLGSKKVICLRGRFHFYEGWAPQDTVFGIKVMAALGVKTIIVTNAAGGLDKSFTVGDIMLIKDHISFVGMAGNNALVGPNDDTVGPRFPSVSSVYDEKLGAVFAEVHAEKKAEHNHSHELREGCYVGLSGPNYESRHEIEMLRTCGGSAVGMSTVNEVVVAAHCGLKVLGLTLITNACLGTREDEYNLPEPNHAEVVDETKKVESFVQDVVSSFVDRVDLSTYKQAGIAAKYARENIDEAVKAEKQSKVVEIQEETKCETKCGMVCPITGRECVILKALKNPCVKSTIISLIGGVLGGFIGSWYFSQRKQQ